MNIAVVFAGGVGSRMNSRSIPKQFLSIHGKPIIIHTLENFENHPEIDAITIACIESGISYLEELLEKYNIKKVKKIVPGGKTGQLSIYHGLCAAEAAASGEKSIVLIHDGVRPFITPQVISENIASVREYGSAITCVRAKETVLTVDGYEGMAIKKVLDRKKTCFARAPQSFWLDEILGMQRKALEEGKDNFIDSCSLMQYFGKQLNLVEGPEENIKITTPDDFYIMRALLDAREDMQINGLGM